MSFDRWVEGEFVYVSEQKARELNPNAANPGDLVFTQRGTIGQVAIIPSSPYERYVISQSQMKLTVDSSKADTLFLYYIFKTNEQQDYIHRNAIQTGVPHTNLETLRNTPIKLPPLPEQCAISHVLGSLDDKIELNRRMNQTLEAIASAVFKTWFVENPEAEKWEVKPLDKIANFLNGLALQKFPPKGDDYLPVIKIAQLRKNDTVDADKASTSVPAPYIVNDGDVLFSWSGSLEVVIWCGGKGALNQHLFKVTSDEYPKWFYYQWIKSHLPEFQQIAAGKATTMGHIQRHHLSAAEVIVPPQIEMVKFDKIMTPILDRLISNNLEVRTLAMLRDALLPKLMSGEVQVRV